MSASHIARLTAILALFLGNGLSSAAQTSSPPDSATLPIARNVPAHLVIPWVPLSQGASGATITHQVEQREVRLRAWVFDPAYWRVTVVPAPERTGLSAHEALQGLAAAGAVLAINGGYFDYIEKNGERGLRPTGLVIAAGKLIHRRGSGSGVIYDKRGRVNIVWSRNIKDWRGADDALQAGPLLVDPGGKHGIRKNSGRSARRSVLCLLHDGRFVFVVARTPITLFDLAGLLSDRRPYGMGCERAINLDGGPSTQVQTAFDGNIEGIAGWTRVVNALAVVPRQ